MQLGYSSFGLIALSCAGIILLYQGDDALTNIMASALMIGMMLIFLYVISQQKHEVIATIEPNASYTEIESQYELVKHIDDLYWLTPRKVNKGD